jgi:hypothetical protein
MPVSIAWEQISRTAITNLHRFHRQAQEELRHKQSESLGLNRDDRRNPQMLLLGRARLACISGFFPFHVQSF